ncbi:MAG: WD40/YVTN/BNR-like repeat-containing protein [Janthinobacterium lividum]
MRGTTLLIPFLIAPVASAQFLLQGSGSNASLRGISVGDARGQVAWASGTAGTILRTLDGGAHWSACAVPPDAGKLDFRGIQAFDSRTAVVMSSGKGDASRVYKTVDGCASWKLILANPDAPDGFFDAIVFNNRNEGWVLGDPVKGHFYLANTQDGGQTWLRSKADGLQATSAGGAFAASNQSLLLSLLGPVFGGGGARLYRGVWPQCSQSTSYNDPGQCLDRIWFTPAQLPLAGANGSSGIFALAENMHTVVAVGGDYTAPDAPAGTAAWSADEGITWHAATMLPHGYRSSVAYSVDLNAWIAVGPNGTDISRDDGRSWQPLLPNAAKGDAPDADRAWNALALPFVVGSKGRIGKLRADALTQTTTK